MASVKSRFPWQEALADLITDPKELLALLELSPALQDAAYQASKLFPLKVPREFVTRMQKNNPKDPLLLQVLPLAEESNRVPGYSHDPLQELKANPVPGLLHKYKGRVLVTLTGACAVHCRYCFRRNFPYENNNPGTAGWEKIFDYIKVDKTISEVILSGGDPLVVHEKYLKLFTDQLTLISHVKRLRFHTRLPIVLPSRITPEFVDYLSQLNMNVVIVLHANHANEINNEVKKALAALRRTKVVLLNQSVLLKNVNDNVAALITLSERLFDSGVMPYYLHVLDKAQGTAHFDSDMTLAKQLHAAMCETLPGYLVPKLVREEAGKGGKVLL